MARYSNSRVGVYVDGENIRLNGGFGMRFDVLREFACRDGAEAVRLNAYVAYDEARAERDPQYRKRANEFHFRLRDFGYKVNRKTVKWYTDENGNRFGKANADLDMAVDALLQSKNLDRVLLATGDGDFVQVVKALQNRGCRVEIVAFENVSGELRREADMFMPGHLIPNLLPVQQKEEKKWGDIGSRVMGLCYHSRCDQGFGFMRYLKDISPGLWVTDARNPDSPYETVYFGKSDLPAGVDTSSLPSRNVIFSFQLANNKEGLRAKNIELVAKI